MTRSPWRQLTSNEDTMFFINVFDKHSKLLKLEISALSSTYPIYIFPIHHIIQAKKINKLKLFAIIICRHHHYFRSWACFSSSVSGLTESVDSEKFECPLFVAWYSASWTPGNNLPQLEDGNKWVLNCFGMKSTRRALSYTESVI